MNLDGKTILITGIGGFVGLRATELAIQRGMRVKGLDYAPQATAAEALGAEVIIGSTTDPEAAAQACAGVDLVLHTAELLREEGDLEEFRAVNVQGTVNIAKAAIQSGASCFVHLSSAMVYGFRFPNQVTEAGPLYTGNNPYCQTKIEAEQALMALDPAPDFGMIILRPGDIYGPGAPSWVVRPLQMMKDRLFALVDGGKSIMNHLYIDNLIDGIFLTVEQAAYGETFNITDGEATTWQDYALQLSAISGLPMPVSMPKFAVKTLVRMSGGSISMAAVELLLRPYPYSIAKICALGYRPAVSLEQGMAHTAAWLQQTDIYSD